MTRASLFAKLGVLIVPDFFDAETCTRVREEMRASTITEAKVVARGGNESVVDPGQRSGAWALVSAATVELVTERLSALKPKVEEFFDERYAEAIEPPKFMIYRAGDFFTLHRDRRTAVDSVDNFGRRRINVIIHVDDTSETDDGIAQAALTLWGLIAAGRWKDIGFPIVGTPGSLVAFRADTLHSVSPIARGERWAIISRYLADHAEAGPADEIPQAAPGAAR